MSVDIQFDNVSKSFCKNDAKRGPAFRALDGFTLSVAPGEFLAIVGPSGCGKSTLLDLLSGLSAPSGGRILLDGRPIAGPGTDRSLVFQQYALFPWRTALANVEFGLELKSTTRSERRERARHYLALVGLSGFEDRYPYELSGGMKQRVAIARSLACDPQVLMMDEPFAALDAQTREILQAELVRIWRATSKTIVFITHSIDEAIYLGQRVAIMTSRPGRVKTVIDVPDSLRAGGEGTRARPEFGRLRQQIWSLLRAEVQRALEQERRTSLGELQGNSRQEGAPAHG